MNEVVIQLLTLKCEIFSFLNNTLQDIRADGHKNLQVSDLPKGLKRFNKASYEFEAHCDVDPIFIQSIDQNVVALLRFFVVDLGKQINNRAQFAKLLRVDDFLHASD